MDRIVKYETTKEKLEELMEQSTSQPKKDMETVHLQKQPWDNLEQSTEALFPPKLNCDNLSLDAHLETCRNLSLTVFFAFQVF